MMSGSPKFWVLRYKVHLNDAMPVGNREVVSRFKFRKAKEEPAEYHLRGL